MTNRWHTLTMCYAHMLKVMPERATLAPPIWRLAEAVLLNGRAVMQKGVLAFGMNVRKLSETKSPNVNNALKSVSTPSVVLFL